MTTLGAITPDDRGLRAATQWLTLDEVAKVLRFPSRRALLFYLRSHPTAKLYQRAGQRRYFMRRDDIDQLMEPVQVQLPPRKELDRPADDADDMLPVAMPAAKPPRRGRKAVRR